jgi:CubicO group peptidase (beta-lactamase class C family)
LQEFVAQLRTVTLDAPVGSRYIYCSGNYNVLGRLVERVSGQSFADYMREHVFAPLHMAHSYASEAPARADGLAQGHRWIFGEVTPMSYYNPSGVPSGYLVSTAADMAHFLTASLNGGRYRTARILSARSVSIMQRSWVDTGDGGTYGLGWHQGQLGGVTAVYHYGENYNTETLAFLEPATGRGAVILVNGQGLLAVPALRSIETGVARMLANENPGKPAMSVGTAYVLFDTLVLATAIAALLPLFRLSRWRRSLQGRARLRRRTLARVAGELTLPMITLVAIQVLLGMIGATWREMFRLVPDVMTWLTGLCVLVFLAGTAHAVLAVQQARDRRAAG